MLKRLLQLAVLITALSFQNDVYAVSTSTCYDTDTVVMLHTDGSDGSTTFTDNSDCVGCPNTFTPSGDAQIDTAQSKFGGASALFDGTNDDLAGQDVAEYQFGQKFTVDWWIRFNVLSNFYIGAGTQECTGATYCWRLGFVTASNQFQLFIQRNTSPKTFAWSPSINTWYHVAITRDGSDDVRMFVDGTQIGSTTSDTAIPSTFSEISLPANSNYNGWYDEMRVVIGEPVWTGDFTAPTGAYTDCSPAVATGGTENISVGSNPMLF